MDCVSELSILCTEDGITIHWFLTSIDHPVGLTLTFTSRFVLGLVFESPSQMIFHIGLQRAAPGQKAGG